MSDDESLWNSKQAAEALGISIDYLRGLCRRKELTCFVDHKGHRWFHPERTRRAIAEKKSDTPMSMRGDMFRRMKREGIKRKR